MAPVCTDLNLSDEQKCTQEATSSNGLFCRFHLKQCYALYKGYKTRNARLDALDAKPPTSLSGKGAIQSADFKDIDDEHALEALHKYLFKRYGLLDRVIRARKLHHSRFFSLSLDYGHKAWLDHLTNARFVTTGPRAQQDDEEAARETEAKQIKREADLFKRHWHEMQARLQRKRKLEDRRRQEAFLEQAYQDRHQIAEEEDEADWDPIEDEIEEDRSKFVDMLRHLLWLSTPLAADTETEPQNTSAGAEREDVVHDKENVDPIVDQSELDNKVPAKTLNRNQKKRAKKQAKAPAIAQSQETNAAEDRDTATPRIEVNETREQVRERLLKGQTFDWRTGSKFAQVAGTVERPAETQGKILGLPADEVDALVEEIAEIKQLLVCRLLLSQAVLLPAALRAATLGDFFNDSEVTAPELRDLCLRLEQPSLQEIKDACADFSRSDDDEDARESYNLADDEQEAHDSALDKKQKGRSFQSRYEDMPDYWKSKHELKLERDKGQNHGVLDREGDAQIDFGDVDEAGEFTNKRIKVVVCGKSIWNYPPEKGTKFGDAIQLCRNWDEFWELNILTIYGRFPSSSWAKWPGDRGRTQFLQLGFIPRYQFKSAHNLTTKHQSNGRGMGPKAHDIVQFRNVWCAHIKRADPVSRRFVQYLQLMAGDLCLLVRDAKTGRIVVHPPKEQWWLAREKTNLGRAARNEWKVKGEVGEQMFEQLSESVYSDFRFSFRDHYDVIIWDLKPGQPYEIVQGKIHGALLKANRFTTNMDCYSKAESTLRTIHREKDTMRCRDVRPGEDSVWDDMIHPDSYGVDKLLSADGQVRDMTVEEKVDRYYNDIDAAEDAVLFPEELEGLLVTAIGSHADRITRELEEAGPHMTRFVHGLHSDDDSEDYEDSSTRADVLQKKKRLQIEHKKGKGPAKTKALTRKQRNAVFNSRKETGPSGSSMIAGLEEARLRDYHWDAQVEACPNDYTSDCECAACEEAEFGGGLHTELVGTRHGHATSDDGEADWEDDEGIPLDDEKSEDGITDVDLAAVESDPSKLKKLMHFVFSDGPQREDVERAFALHIDRERAKAFKPQWHAADFEPGAFERYAELQSLMEQSRAMNRKSSYMRGRQMQLLLWLNCHLSEHRLVGRDIEDTFAFVGLFFFPDLRNLEIDEWRRSLNEMTKLVDNEYKAGLEPCYKDWRDATDLPKDMWPPMGPYNDSHDPPGGDIPREWDKISRPQVARLYKAGIIAPYHHSDPAGRLIVANDPLSRRLTMFMDYRRTPRDIPSSVPPNITDRTKVDLLQIAQAYKKANPSARFTLLRIWSHSHFWPLMVGYESRDPWSFQDCKERSWQWKFYPKERYGGAYNMQATVDQRLKRWKSQLGKNVRVRRDILLSWAKIEMNWKR